MKLVLFDLDGTLIMEGAKETIAKLKERGIKTGIISGNSAVADMIKKELGLDYSITNEISGPLTGEDSRSKAFEKIVKKAGVSLRDSAVVSSANDLSAFEKAGLCMAFNSKPAPGKAADVIIYEKDLTRILPYIFGELDMEAMIRERDMLELRMQDMKRDIVEKKAALGELGNKKRELIQKIKTKNKKANESKKLRDELNWEVKKLKEEREKMNEHVKALVAKYKKLKESAPKGDYKKIQKEIDALEWKLQTSVMEIKKEDALVDRIKKLNQELKGYKELIELSKEIDRHKSSSRKVHEEILKLSKESQQQHEKFLQAVAEIKEAEAKIDELNSKRKEIDPALDKLNEELNSCVLKIKELEKSIKRVEAETELKPKSDRELKEEAKSVYGRFKKGEKLTLEDIYLLRRFNLV